MATEKRPSMANCLCTLYKKYDFNMHEGHLLPTKATFVPGCPAFSGLTTHLLFFLSIWENVGGGGGYEYISIFFSSMGIKNYSVTTNARNILAM